jgi:hypothetical protein
MDKIVCSLEEWDSVIDYHRPNGASKSWYLKELGELKRPLMWGNWDLFDEKGEFFTSDVFKGKIASNIYNEKIEYQSIDNIQNDKHIYIINIFNVTFFYENLDIGFSCISEKYLNDVRNGKSKIVLMLLYEGTSGSKDNYDLEIINKWRKDSDLPTNSIYFCCGNLLCNQITIEKGLGITSIPILDFEAWNKYQGDVVEYYPINDRNLFLNYNRNCRLHRIEFLNNILNADIFDRGLISLGKVDDGHGHNKFLVENSPITIDESYDLKFNMACNITKGDYEKTFLSVVSETLVDEDTLFITEKTWKPIMVGHPFMILGNQGTLKYLKSIGYKTFSSWINEEYDDISDSAIRSVKIVEELEKLSKKSVEELVEIRKEMMEICKHNHENFNVRFKMKYGENNINGDISNMFDVIWNEIN